MPGTSVGFNLVSFSLNHEARGLTIAVVALASQLQLRRSKSRDGALAVETLNSWVQRQLQSFRSPGNPPKLTFYLLFIRICLKALIGSDGW